MSKDLLDKRELELIEALKDIEAAAAPVDLSQPIGRISRMDLMQQQQLALSRQKSMKLNLEQVKSARKRLDDGDYGCCLNCEEEISKKRLTAYPEAPFCINCTRS